LKNDLRTVSVYEETLINYKGKPSSMLVKGTIYHSVSNDYISSE